MKTQKECYIITSAESFIYMFTYFRKKCVIWFDTE
jgi:hypothetical protein